MGCIRKRKYAEHEAREYHFNLRIYHVGGLLILLYKDFCEFQSQMLTNLIFRGHLTGHFFAVYDGHGGCEVANYCRERIHVALAEEIEAEKVRLSEGSVGGNFDELWKKAFTNCFLKVDGLIGEANEPVAPETVGSTAVVAI